MFDRFRRAIIGQIGRLRKSPVDLSSDRRKGRSFKSLDQETRDVLNDYTKGRITATELRVRLDELDPAPRKDQR